MFKELILAIILGCLLGFGVTGGYLAVKKGQASNTPTNVQTPSPSPANQSAVTPLPTTSTTNTSDSNADNSLIISSPDNESIVSSSRVNLQGNAAANTSIIITTSKDTFYISTDNSGAFQQELTLEPGANFIQVDATTSRDEIISRQILVTYSTAKF